MCVIKSDSLGLWEDSGRGGRGKLGSAQAVGLGWKSSEFHHQVSTELSVLNVARIAQPSQRSSLRNSCLDPKSAALCRSLSVVSGSQPFATASWITSATALGRVIFSRSPD